ncbi:MAG: hypothetical protein KY444_08800, partial [Gemmatimonadetes bacterium]|nr:hypothetical protein [Gemmatimonadota bacterium]
MSLDLETPSRKSAAPSATPGREGRARRVLRRLAYTLAGLAALVALALLGARWYIGRAEPDYGRGASL